MQEDDALRPGCEVGQAGQTPGVSIGRLRRDGRRQSFRTKQRTERTDADAPGRQAEQLPPRQVQIQRIGIHGITAW